MLSPEEVLAQVESRLRKTWSQVVTDLAAWSTDFRLGTSGLSGARLAESWTQTHRQALRWREWVAAAGEGVTVVDRGVHVHRSPQQLPATLRISSIDDAARLIGEEWVARLERSRRRHAALSERFPDLDDPAAILRSTDTWSDIDFDLAARTARWFAEPHPAGLTARQVPVEGLGTKWLDARQGVVRRLAGVDRLDLESGRPQRVHLTYLDPRHLAEGGRRHDVATVGDADAVAYRPRVVLISENRDTAQQFPPVPGGIAVEGDGRGAGAAAAMAWIRDAERLFYWGDMDPDGLEILHGYRAAGLRVRSLLMDRPAYQTWERFGVDHDHQGKPIGAREPREVGELEPHELALYVALCSPEWTRHRRIEQERIPLDVAADIVRGAG